MSGRSTWTFNERRCRVEYLPPEGSSMTAEIIAHVENCDSERGLANGYLIAAAPDLLRVAELLVADAELTQFAIDELRAAIGHAKGEVVS